MAILGDVIDRQHLPIAFGQRRAGLGRIGADQIELRPARPFGNGQLAMQLRRRDQRR
jgi:hypothetical protein